MSLEFRDSTIWSYGLIIIAIHDAFAGDIHYSIYLAILLILAWLNNLIHERPVFRHGSAPQIVGGLLSVPTALVALESNHAFDALLISITFAFLFLLSKQRFPTLDFKFSIVVLIGFPCLVSYFSNQNIILSLVTIIFSSFVITVIMRKATGSFTVGEAIMVATLSGLPIRTVIDFENPLVQIDSALILDGILCLCMGLLIRRPICIVFGFLPLYFAVYHYKYLIQFIFDIKRIAIIGYCAAVCVIFILISVFWKGLSNFPQIVQRKFFHIMALLVFIVPVSMDVILMRFAISGAIYIFLFVEMLRLTRFPFVATMIESYVGDFLDERDSGELILTHLFLLLGCGLPVIFSSNEGFGGMACKVCGISVLAIGDAAASAIGIKFGKHKWPGSKKSIEGTIGAFFGTWITIVVLTSIGVFNIDIIKSLLLSIPSLVGALDEAFTSQIDNLTLPFVILPFVVECMNLRF